MASLSWATDLGPHVAGGVIAGMIGFGFGYSRERVVELWRHGRFESFWGAGCRSGTEKVFVVMGVYRDTRPATGDRYVKRLSTGERVFLPGGQEVGSVAEGRAASYLSSALAEHRSTPPGVSSDRELLTQWDGTFLCLGSGYSNEKSRVILDLNENVFCEFLPGPMIRSKWDGETYSIQQSPPRDRSLIVKLRNPWMEGHSLVVCAGLAEPGTAGAAYYLARNWQKLQRRYGESPFGIVLEVDWSSDQTAREIAHSPPGHS